jgi:tetratricopeptide (TPR) repeat protein
MWHEFVHVITLQKTKNRMPRWLSEGISVYEEANGGPGWGQAMEPSFKPILAEDGWPKTADLERYFTAPKSQFHLIYGYFLAGEFVRSYIDAYGIAALNKSLDLMGKGIGALDALQSGAGVNLDAIDAKFKARLEVRCETLKNIPSPPAEAAANPGDAPEGGRGGRGGGSGMMDADSWFALKSPFTDAVRDGIAAVAAGNYAAGAERFEKGYELFPDYTGERAPLRLLAQMYHKQGERAKELAALRRIVRWDPTALAECRRLTQMLVEDKQWEEAIETARLAFDIDPFDVDNLKDIHDGLVALGRSKDAIPVTDKLAYLDKAHEADFRLEHARLLAETGETEQAKEETLALLEGMPYFWDAQRLLLRIVDAKPEAKEAATP